MELTKALRLLGVPHDVSDGELRSAWRAYARAYHPDLNADPQAASLFTAGRAAYEALQRRPQPVRRGGPVNFGRTGVISDDAGRASVYRMPDLSRQAWAA